MQQRELSKNILATDYAHNVIVVQITTVKSLCIFDSRTLKILQKTHVRTVHVFPTLLVFPVADGATQTRPLNR